VLRVASLLHANNQASSESPRPAKAAPGVFAGVVRPPISPAQGRLEICYQLESFLELKVRTGRSSESTGGGPFSAANCRRTLVVGPKVQARPTNAIYLLRRSTTNAVPPVVPDEEKRPESRLKARRQPSRQRANNNHHGLQGSGAADLFTRRPRGKADHVIPTSSSHCPTIALINLAGDPAPLPVPGRAECCLTDPDGRLFKAQGPAVPQTMPRPVGFADTVRAFPNII